MEIFEKLKKHCAALFAIFLVVFFLQLSLQKALAIEIFPKFSSGSSTAIINLSSLWSGKLVGANGDSPEIKNASASYSFDVSSQPENLLVGSNINVSQSEQLLSFEIGGGILEQRLAYGNWTETPEDSANCLESENYVGLENGNQFAFSMCAKKSSFTLVSSDSTVVSCSGLSCSALKAGIATITAIPSITKANFWGSSLLDGDSYQNLGIIDIATNNVSWNVTAYDPPTVNISASALSIPAGSPVTLTWTSTNSDSCTATGNWAGPKTLSGSENLTLNINSNFNIECINAGGSATAQVSVAVTSTIQQPNVSFTANVGDVYEGDVVTLTWLSQGADYGCIASGAWSGTKNVSGEEESGQLFGIGEKIFFLTCSGLGGDRTEVISIDVIDRLAVISPILEFDAIEKNLPYNGSTELVWSAENVASCEAGGNWNGEKDIIGSENIGPLYANMSYSLTCNAFDGQIVTKEVNINVADPIIPTINLYYKLGSAVNPASVPYGSYIGVYWNTANALQCDPDWSTSTSVSGSNGVSLYATRTYAITCWSADGSSSSSQITVNVDPRPLSLLLLADPTVIDANASSTLRWSSSGATYGCFSQITASGWTTVSSMGTGGARNTGILRRGEYIYMMTCYGDAGQTVTQSAQVTAEGVVGAMAEFTFYAEAPVDLDAGTSNTYVIDYNAHVKLLWNAPDALGCVASGSWSGPVSASGSSWRWNLKSNMVYTLTCASGSAIGTKTVIINVLPPALPTIINPRFDINPINFGDTATIRWSVTFNNSNNSGTCYPYAPTPGGDPNYANYTLYPSRTLNSGVYDYSYTIPKYLITDDTKIRIYCYNATGSTSKFLTVIVGDPPGPISMNFRADRYYLNALEATNLKWSTFNTVYCAGLGSWSGWKAAPGGEYAWYTGGITSDKVYFLQCNGLEGQVETKSVSLFVGVTKPKISFWSDSDFSTEGTAVVPYNTKTNLRWSVVSPTDVTCIGENGEDLWRANNKDKIGTYETKRLTEPVLYKLTCTNSFGSISAFIPLDIGNQDAVGPQLSVWADSYVADAGGKATVRWKSSDATSCVFSSTDSLEENVPLQGNKTVTEIFSMKTYVVTCRGPAGNATAKVTISPSGENASPASIEFWADDTTNIPIGSGTMLRWKAENLISCRAEGTYKNESGVVQAVGDWAGNKYLSGNEALSGLQLGEYTLSLVCEDNDARELRGMVLLYVGKSGSGLPIVFYDLRAESIDNNGAVSSPLYILSSGEYMLPYSGMLSQKFLSFSWSTANAVSCTLSDNNDATDDTTNFTGVLPNMRITLDSSINSATQFRLSCTDDKGAISAANLFVNVFRFEVCLDPELIYRESQSTASAVYAENKLSDPVSLSGLSCPSPGVYDVTSSTVFSIPNNSIADISGNLVTGKAEGTTTLIGRYNPGFGELLATKDFGVLSFVDCFSCDVVQKQCISHSRPIACQAEETEDEFACNQVCSAVWETGKYREVAP